MVYQLMKEEMQGERRQSNTQDTVEVRQPLTRRSKFQGTMPEKMTFASTKTFLTPKKAKKKQVERGTAASKVIERLHQCTGDPFEVVCQQVQGNSNNNATNDPRRKCYLCKAKTK